METTWRAPLVWRVLLVLARAIVWPVARLRVSGAVPAPLRGGPLILAVNHVSPFDPVVMMAACGRSGVAPRFMATGGVFRAPVLGWVMRRCGHIRVDRRTAAVAQALPAAAAALAAGSVVLVYPEGRIGLDPQMWPERGKTGTARLALSSGAAVVPVAQWGAHEVVPYTAPRGVWPSLWRALWRRPVVWVRFGAPVDLSGVDAGAPGAAVHATELVMEGIAAALAPLRVDEPGMPRHVDPTRPVDLTRVRRPRGVRPTDGGRPSGR
jgi:1-acyl-sn-glycerol-3-phosphate acyltransferase